MNWDAIDAIGEIVGAAAVVVTFAIVVLSTPRRPRIRQVASTVGERIKLATPSRYIALLVLQSLRLTNCRSWR